MPVAMGGHERTRRTVLGGIGALGLGGVVGTAAANPGNGQGFPPKGRTEYSDPEPLGDGEVRTFLAEHPQGKWTYVGVELTAAAATIDEEEFDEMDLVAIDFPGDTAFEWLGLNWMPEGHGPPDVYGVPHFDVHFYLDPQDDIEDIPPINFPPAGDDNVQEEPYEEPPAADQFPDEYFRTNYVVPAMGEHLFDATSPEWDGPDDPSGEEFTHTHVWGHWNGDLNFYEPMITTAFLEDLGDDGDDVVESITTPERMPEAGDYPTEYRIAYHRNRDAYTITLAEFEAFEKSDGVVENED